MPRLAHIATALMLVAGNAAAQSANPALQNSNAAAVLGATGTMYDGNNANLQLPPERDAWFAEKRAGYVPAQTSPGAPAAATGAGVAGSALGTQQTGGAH